MRGLNTPRPSRWAGLLWMASTASALTLSSFQLITSSGTPIACLIVYNSNLDGCSTRDFTSGNACSPACVAGIVDVQARIVDVCDGVDASSASVLGQAQRGNLLPLLCPSRASPTPQPSTRPVATAVTLISTIAPSRIFSSPSSSALTTTVSSSETARSRPPVPDPPASDLPPPVQPAQPTPTFVQSERPAQPPPTSTGGDRPSPPQATRDSGGGSPFDTVFQGGAGRVVEVRGWVVYVAAAVGLLLAR